MERMSFTGKHLFMVEPNMMPKNKSKYKNLYTSNLTTQPCQNQKTSNLLSRESLTSNLLCHVQNHAFGLIPTKRYFHDFHTSDFYPQTSKIPYIKAFSRPYSFTLDINTTHSTWLERTVLMSFEPSVLGNKSTAFFHSRYWGTYRLESFYFKPLSIAS